MDVSGRICKPQELRPLLLRRRKERKIQFVIDCKEISQCKLELKNVDVAELVIMDSNVFNFFECIIIHLTNGINQFFLERFSATKSEIWRSNCHERSSRN